MSIDALIEKIQPKFTVNFYDFREIHSEFRLNFSLLGHLFSLWEELNKAEREGLINWCERPLVDEVGLNSDRNDDQPFSPGLWHKPGLMVMGQGLGALVPVGATNRD